MLSEAWGLYKNHWKVLLATAAILGLVGLIFEIAGLIILDVAGPPVVFNALLITGFLVTFLLGVWTTLAMLFALDGQADGLLQALGKGGRYILSGLWIVLLASLIILGGYMLFIFPGVVLGVILSLSLMVLVSEKSRGFLALFKSMEYIRGFGIEVFGRFLFLGLVGLIITLVINLPVLVIDFYYLIIQGHEYLPLWVEILSEIIGAIALILIIPLTISYGYLIYKHLRESKGEVVPAVTFRRKLGLILFAVLPILLAILMVMFFGFSAETEPVQEYGTLPQNDDLSVGGGS